jgi:hypothetical protein
MNSAVFLAASAGVAIALQVILNSVGLRDLGLGAPIGISGATTAFAGLAWALFAARPEATGRALLCTLASGLPGAFILASVVLAANRGGARPDALAGDRLPARLRSRGRPAGRLRPHSSERGAPQGSGRATDSGRRNHGGPRLNRHQAIGMGHQQNLKPENPIASYSGTLSAPR